MPIWKYARTTLGTHTIDVRSPNKLINQPSPEIIHFCNIVFSPSHHLPRSVASLLVRYAQGYLLHNLVGRRFPSKRRQCTSGAFSIVGPMTELRGEDGIAGLAHCVTQNIGFSAFPVAGRECGHTCMFLWVTTCAIVKIGVRRARAEKIIDSIWNIHLSIIFISDLLSLHTH